MILGLPKRYAQKVVKKWSPPKREPPKRYAQKVIKKWSPPKREPAQEEPKTLQNTPRGYFAKFGLLEAAILYIFGHIPTNAYAILAAIF